MPATKALYREKSRSNGGKTVNSSYLRERQKWRARRIWIWRWSAWTEKLPDHPTVSLNSLWAGRAEVTSYGYPSGYLEGDEATFEIEGLSTKNNSPLVKLKAGQADWGASGSPILMDRTREVIAVLTLSRDVTSALGGRATPIDLAFVEWPLLRDLQKAAHQRDRRWASLLPTVLWSSWESQQKEKTYREELNQRKGVTPSPLMADWSAFTGCKPWHERIRAQVSFLSEKVSELSPPPEDASAIRDIDFEVNYDGLAGSVRGLVEGPVAKWIQAKSEETHATRDRLVEQKRQGRLTPGLDDEIEELWQRTRDLSEIRNHLGFLEDEIARPCFDKCLLVMGDTGAGKTHFITSILAEAGQEPGREVMILPVRPHLIGNQKLADYLLDQLRDHTRVDWESLEDVENYLSSLEVRPKLMVAIDDLQKAPEGSHFLEELQELIAQNTQVHSLFWTIAIDHQSYIQVSGYGEFWDAYGFARDEENGEDESEIDVSQPPSVDRTTRIGKWLHLDELNEQREIGIQIIRQVVSADADQGAPLLSGLQHLSATAHRHLTKPFIAWALLDIRSNLEVSSLVDLNFIDFISHFWSKFVPRLAEDNAGQSRLQSMVSLTCGYLLEFADFTPVEARLVQYVVSKAQGKSDLANTANAEAALQALKSGALLRPFDVPDPDFGTVQHVELAFDVFWNWTLAKRLSGEFDIDPSTKGDAAKFLDSWFALHKLNAQLSAGVLEFFLLLSAKRGRVDDPAFKQVWRWAGSSAYAPSGGVWFAAAKTSREVQSTLASSLLDPLPKLRDEDRDLFGLIYFLASLEEIPPGLKFADIFGLLSLHYEALNRASLSDYFIYTVRRQLGRSRSVEEVAGAIYHFRDCAILGVAEEVASISLDALYRLEKDSADAVGDDIIEFLKQISNEWIETYKPDPKERFYYREWIIYLFCQRLIDRQGTDAYKTLASSGWYHPPMGIKGPLRAELVRQANFAFADWYRSTWPRPEHEYAGLVTKLAHSQNVEERKAAFYMIRHTQAVHGRTSFQVDKIFRPVLAELAIDKDLLKLAISQRDFFQANAVDDDDLKTEQDGGVAAAGDHSTLS